MLCVGAATACSGKDREVARGPLPPAPPEVVVTMDEFSFEHQSTIPAGRVVFRAVNVGELGHRLSVLPIDDDVPPIKEQLRGSERRSAEPLGGLSARPPGGAGSFAVDLRPGQRYALVCFIVEPDGRSHAQLGMASEFRAGVG